MKNICGSYYADWRDEHGKRKAFPTLKQGRAALAGSQFRRASLKGFAAEHPPGFYGRI